MSIKIEITAETHEQLLEQIRGLFPSLVAISLPDYERRLPSDQPPIVPLAVEQPQAAPSAPEPAAPVAEPEPKKRRARKQESEAPAPEAPAPEPVVPEPSPVAAPTPVEDAPAEEPIAPPPPPAPEPLKVSSQDVLLLGCLIQYGFEDVAFIRSALAEVLGENKSLNAASPEKLAALAEKFIEAINARGDEKWRLAEERDKTLGKKHVASVAGLPRSITSRINRFAK